MIRPEIQGDKIRTATKDTLMFQLMVSRHNYHQACELLQDFSCSDNTNV